jgi:hypothetical protein
VDEETTINLVPARHDTVRGSWRESSPTLSKLVEICFGFPEFSRVPDSGFKEAHSVVIAAVAKNDSGSVAVLLVTFRQRNL